MSYMASNVLIVNILIIPTLVFLWWQMGWKNWPKLLLVIPSYPLSDIDHFILTNVSGFGAQALPNQKILHVFHMTEFLALVITVSIVSFYITSRRKGRCLESWLFPISSDYSRTTRYSLAWTGRIILLGAAIHWLIDLVIYTVHHKWDYLYFSVIEYFLSPT